jgi:thiol-disulfide isomerase/thioredoxin
LNRPVVVFLLACLGCGHPTPGGNGTGPGTGAAAPDAAGSTVDAGPPEKVVQLNEPGAMVNVEASFVPGYVMIVDFWAEWCGACEKVDAAIMAAVADEPKILVRKVHVGDGDTQVADHYDAAGLPYVRVYGADGQLRYALRYNDAFTAGAKAIAVAAEAR